MGPEIANDHNVICEIQHVVLDHLLRFPDLAVILSSLGLYKHGYGAVSTQREQHQTKRAACDTKPSSLNHHRARYDPHEQQLSFCADCSFIIQALL